MIHFSKQKFHSFPVEMQHKKCHELLRTLYASLLDGIEDHELFHHYNLLQEWMQTPRLKELELKKIADRFHWHLEQTPWGLKEENLLPSVTRNDRLQGQTPFPITIHLDNIRSAHNVGSIVRTTEAFGLGSLHFGGMTPTAEHPMVKKTAMGTASWVKWDAGLSLSTLPRPILALETSDDATSIYRYPFPESFTLVLGNEEYGCSEESLTVADDLVQIPLRGRKNSLNVANAFAITAAEIVRQKKDHE